MGKLQLGETESVHLRKITLDKKGQNLKNWDFFVECGKLKVFSIVMRESVFFRIFFQFIK